MGGKKKPVIGYYYYMGIHMGLGRGPLNAILEIEAGGKTAWKGNATTSEVVQIDAPELFGGKKKEGGIQGPLTVMMGEPAQTAPAGLAAMLGGDVPGFRGMCTLFFDGLISAMNPYIKPWKIRVRRHTAGWEGGTAWYAGRAMIALADGEIQAMNPAHIIYEALTNRDWGGGNDRARLHDGSFRAAADTLYAEGFGLCLRWSRQDSINAFVQIVLDHIGGALVQSRFDGLLHLKLIRDDYNPSSLPLFDEDSGLLGIDEDDNAASDGAANEIIIDWHDPIKNEPRSWRERNLAGVAADGRVLSQAIDYPGLPTPELAGRVAVRELRSRAAAIKRFKVRLDRRAWRIEPGDVFRIRSLQRGIDNIVLRAGRVEDGKLTDGTITVTTVQDIFGLPATAMTPPQPPGWVAPDRTPLPIATRRLVEASWRDLAASLDPANLAVVDETACYLGAIAARPNPAAFNFELQSRVGAGEFIAQSDGNYSPSGVLDAAMSPTATTINVVNGNDLDFVEVGGPVMIDNEVMRLLSWDAAAGTGAVARGCVDTVPAAHAAGARVWFGDAGGADATAYAPGVAVQARLLTCTSIGQLDPTQAAVDSLTMTQRQARPYPPGRLRINGTAYPASVSGEVTVSWAHRDRLLQADQLIDTEAGNIGPEPGVTYRLRLYSGSTLRRTYAGITGTSQTYTAADETADGGPFNPIRIVLDCERAALYSAQVHDVTVGRT